MRDRESQSASVIAQRNVRKFANQARRCEVSRRAWMREARGAQRRGERDRLCTLVREARRASRQRRQWLALQACSERTRDIADGVAPDPRAAEHRRDQVVAP